MEASSSKASAIGEKIDKSDEYASVSVHDYSISTPIVDINFEVIDTETAERVTEIINIEELKSLFIYINSVDMIPTAMMFCLRDHRFTQKIISINKNKVPGWELVYSFFLTSNAHRVWVD